jgi:hypothetical protein
MLDAGKPNPVGFGFFFDVVGYKTDDELQLIFSISYDFF